MGDENRITDMAFLRKRASGKYSLSFKWKGRSYIKALGTDDEQDANKIKEDAEAQLTRIRRGESALASKLLADGHSIVDVLFGSEKIAHLINSPADDNPLTLSELKEAFAVKLRATDRTPGARRGNSGPPRPLPSRTAEHLSRDLFAAILAGIQGFSLPPPLVPCG